MSDEDEFHQLSDEAEGLEAQSSEDKMAGILQGLQSTLKEFTQASRSQTETLSSIREDFLLQPDATDQDERSGNGTENDLNVSSIVANLLESSTEHEAPKSSPDAAVDDDVIDRLTQAYLANPKLSPPVETKIASFIEQVLTGELSSDMLKETGEKYPPPDNCQHLTTVTVNEEIWDLLSRKSRTVDLGFQKVQGLFMQGLSTLTILAEIGC